MFGGMVRERLGEEMMHTGTVMTHQLLTVAFLSYVHLSGLSNPVGLLVTQAGDLLASNSYGSVSIFPAGLPAGSGICSFPGQCSTYVSGSIPYGFFSTFDSTQQNLFITNGGTGQVNRVTLGSPPTQVTGWATSGTSATGVAIDSYGSVYFTDFSGSCISKFGLSTGATGGSGTTIWGGGTVLSTPRQSTALY